MALHSRWWTVRTAAWIFLGGLLLVSLSAPVRGQVRPVGPKLVGGEHLSRWRSAISKADRGEGDLRIVALGDSNTEATTWIGEVRRILYGCYGDGGLGYHTLGARIPVPGGPKMDKVGNWTDRDTSPIAPPAPWLGMDGLWTETDDPSATAAVELAGPHMVRLHYATGPGLGRFAIAVDGRQVAEVQAAADTWGYAITPPIWGRSIRVQDISGRVILLGVDLRRRSFTSDGRRQEPTGSVVHAMGNAWGQAGHQAGVEQVAYDGFYKALSPDLTIVLLGTNDMHNQGNVRDYDKNMRTIVRKIRAADPNADVLIVSCPEAGQTRPGVAEAYATTAAAVAEQTGCAFWDLRTLIGPRSQRWRRLGLFADGLHYTQAGGAAWARSMMGLIDLDPTDPRHTRALRRPLPEPTRTRLAVSRLPEVADPARLEEALSEAPVHRVYCLDAPAAEIRFGLTATKLLVRAVVTDSRCTPQAAPWEASNFDVYVARPGVAYPYPPAEGDPRVQQLVFRATAPGTGAVSAHASGRSLPAPDLAWRVLGRDDDQGGYVLEAVIPLEQVGLEAGTDELLLEFAVVASPRPTYAPRYARCFLPDGAPDRGAFRDPEWNAHVSAKDERSR